MNDQIKVHFVIQQCESKTDFSRQNQQWVGISSCDESDLELDKIVKIQSPDNKVTYYQIFKIENRESPKLAFAKAVDDSKINEKNLLSIEVQFVCQNCTYPNKSTESSCKILPQK